jgi:hypothetical protein
VQIDAAGYDESGTETADGVAVVGRASRARRWADPWTKILARHVERSPQPVTIDALLAAAAVQINQENRQ